MGTPQGLWRFHFGGHPSRIIEGWSRLAAPLDNESLDPARSQVGLMLAGLRDNIGQQPPVRVGDVFTVAVAAYIADRRAPRPKSGRRRIEMNIPVAEPDTFNHPRVRELLGALLQSLTADEWKVHFRQDTNPVLWQGSLIPVDVASVALFSGGLDSFCHATTLPRSKNSRSILVSHGVTSRLRERQRELREALRSDSFLSAQFQIRINEVRGAGREAHPRTRPMLLLGAGILMCAANGVDTLHCPENGLLALHPERTPLWSDSGTSVHPMTMHLVNELLSCLDTGQRVVNPYRDLTKGEVCERAVESGWKRSLLGRTITCVNPQQRSHDRFGNCGYCRHCLVRHAALVNVGGDLTEYRDVFPPEIPMMSPGPHDRDLRAVRAWLKRDLTNEQFAPLPHRSELATSVAVVQRARRELADIYGGNGLTDVQAACLAEPGCGH